MLANRSQECDAGAGDCGQLECVINYHGYANRCESIGCLEDSECEAKYGGLCDDVEWICTGHITADNRRCEVRGVDADGTGIALCDAIDDTEGCGSEHVDRCEQGWPADVAEFPYCESQSNALMGCLADASIECYRDADVAIYFGGQDPENPQFFTEGLYAFDLGGILYYPGCACGSEAVAWDDCRYGGSSSGGAATGGGGCGGYVCNDGDCIEWSWICDGESDCSGGEDEVDCGGCPPSRPLECNDGECIAESWVCDGEADCSGGEDEAECCPSSHPIVCNDDYTCIQEDWICDGEADCLSGEDEYDC